MKVVKFGGSSVADAGQFQKVKAIIDQDVNRQIVVISAAGKYGNATRKLTLRCSSMCRSSNCCIQFAIIWPFAILETIWSLAVSS